MKFRRIKFLSIILLLLLIIDVQASGGVSISKDNISIKEGEETSFSIDAENIKEKLDLEIKTSDGEVTIIDLSGIEVCSDNKCTLQMEQNEKKSINVKVKGVKVGTAEIQVIFSDNKTYDEDDVKGNLKCNVTVTSKNVAVEGISLDKTSATLEKGKSLKLNATITPNDATNKAINWTSSNINVVTVDTDGNVLAKGVGTATITATARSNIEKSVTATITVTEPKITAVTISGSSDVNIGGTTTLTAEVLPKEVDQTVIWSSSDSSIATVNNKGVIKGIREGVVTITVKTKNGTVIAKSTITIENVPTPTSTPMVIESLSFNENNISVKKGNSLNLVVEVKPTELSSSKLTWKSSDSSIVSVDENGVIKGLKEGTTTITVTSSNGKSATCKVTVTAESIDVEKIILNPTEMNLKVGSTSQITSKVLPENATNRELVWTSSDESIVTVDDKGIVKGVKAGIATITVKTKDGKVVATVNVTIEDDEPTFKVFDEDKSPIEWDGATDLKIFSRSIHELDGIIAPESSNTYKFVVKNNTDYKIKYSIKFIESNDYDINMKYKLKKNDAYIIDTYSKANTLDITGYVLNKGETDTYYLDWKWISSDNDTTIGQNPSANYGLKIEVEAESINE